jgi:hypothetical protein
MLNQWELGSMIVTANIVMKRYPDLKIKDRHVNPMKCLHQWMHDGRYHYEAMFLSRDQASPL